MRLLAFLGLFLSLALAAPEEVAREAVARWLKGELSPRLEEVLKALHAQAPLSLREWKGELEGLAERLRALASEVYALEVRAKRPLEDNSAEALRRELGLF